MLTIVGAVVGNSNGEVRQELEHRDEDYSLLSQEMEEQRYDLKFQSQQTSGLRAALLEFCPSLSSAEDMKRFYDTVCPVRKPY